MQLEISENQNLSLYELQIKVLQPTATVEFVYQISLTKLLFQDNLQKLILITKSQCCRAPKFAGMLSSSNIIKFKILSGKKLLHHLPLLRKIFLALIIALK